MRRDDLYPLPLTTLVARLERELDEGGSLYTLKRRDWFTPPHDVDLSFDHLGKRLATPLGLASGPHTQLAQNLLIGWLAGARFFELKTVQVNDQLEIPRPCIFVPHVGYNVEWSQELLVQQSATEYAKGWLLVHLLADALGMGVDASFDVSVGYDLEGLRSEKVRQFLSQMRDAGELLATLRAELPERWAAVDVPAALSDSLTISTFHGCPADEIEAIAEQCLDWGWHTVVKLNPTLHGYERCRELMDGMGYTDVQLDPHAFEVDLQWAQLEAFIPRLEAKAAALGLGFGVKFTNTLVCRSDEPPFGDGEMYLSGPPLHVLAYQLAARFRTVFPELPVTFSAGVDPQNFADTVKGGIGPITTCSDLLKQGGYARMRRYLAGLGKAMEAEGAATVAAFGSAQHLQARAAGLADEPAYHRAANSKPPKKVGTHLELFDCLTCDKCIPVCPNLANFALPMPAGEHHPGRVRWEGGTFTLSEGEPLVVTKRHQIGNLADACNLCGECDPWCPEDGGPYIEKPSVWSSERGWRDHTARDAFYVEPGYAAIRWRRGDTEMRLSVDGDAARFELPGGAVLFEEDEVVATEGSGDVDLRLALTMKLYLDAFRRARSTIWLPEA